MHLQSFTPMHYVSVAIYVTTITRFAALWVPTCIVWPYSALVSSARRRKSLMKAVLPSCNAGMFIV